MSRGLQLDRLADRCVRTRSGCLIWRGATHAGYGVVVRRGRRLRLHRIVVELADGKPIPPGLHVRHVCPRAPRRACLERRHLAIGTPAQNVADMVAAGRQARGERHGLHKLTVAMVRHARRARSKGTSYGALAVEAGVTKTTIRSAVRGVTWKWLSS